MPTGLDWAGLTAAICSRLDRCLPSFCCRTNRSPRPLKSTRKSAITESTMMTRIGSSVRHKAAILFCPQHWDSSTGKGAGGGSYQQLRPVWLGEGAWIDDCDWLVRGRRRVDDGGVFRGVGATIVTDCRGEEKRCWWRLQGTPILPAFTKKNTFPNPNLWRKDCPEETVMQCVAAAELLLQ